MYWILEGHIMTPERWERLVLLFHVLHDTSEPERITLLERTRAMDPELVPDLERMLREELQTDDFLDQALVTAGNPVRPDIDPGE